MSDSDKKVFVREATGLVKQVGFLGAISLNLSDLAVGSTLALIPYTLIVLPTVTGVNLLGADIIAFALIIPQIIAYTMMQRRMPRTGGDYVWVSRSLGGFWGNAMLWVGPCLNGLPFIALIAMAGVFSIGAVGLFFGNNSFLGIAVPQGTAGASPDLQFVIAIAIFGLLILINILSPKWGFRTLTILSSFAIIATILAIGTYLIGGHNGVVNYMNVLNSEGAGATYASVASSYSGTTFNLSNTLFLIPYFAIFAYPFMNGTPAASSEFKGSNAIKWSIPVSLLIVFTLDTVAIAAMYYAAGFNFITAAFTNPTLVYNYTFNFWTLAMGIANNSVLATIIGLGWVAWNFCIVGLIIIMFSRYLFAQAFDRFLPERFAYVSPRWGSPLVAHIIDFVVVGTFLAVAALLYGTFQSLYATVIGSMFYFLAVGVGIALYGYRKEHGSVKGVLTICGGLMVVVYLYVIYTFFAYPAIWGTSVLVDGVAGYIFSYAFVLACFILAAIVWFVQGQRLKKVGLNINMAYKEIPPE